MYSSSSLVLTPSSSSPEHARRKGIHEATFQSPLSTHNFIERFISELDQAKKSKPDKKERVPIPSHATWIPPSPGMAKLNVDVRLSR
jgi:hypothetical protein